MLIFAEEAAKILGRKSIGRDDLRAMGIKYMDGPATRGGNRLILVDEESCREVATTRKAKVSGPQPYNNKEALDRRRFVNTVAAMESLELLHRKVDEIMQIIKGSSSA